MNVYNIVNGDYSVDDESPIETEDGDLDKKMEKMQEMMGNMEQLNNTVLKTLYMQIFMGPAEKIMEW